MKVLLVNYLAFFYLSEYRKGITLNVEPINPFLVFVLMFFIEIQRNGIILLNSVENCTH